MNRDPRVALAFDGPVARLTLKRAEKLNALDMGMIEGLFAAAQAIEAHPDARVAILAAEGKAFCAGGDIAAWGGLEPLAMWRDWTRAGHRAFEALARLRVPLVAVLAGHAFGGGLELAATADIRLAEEGARFGLPETGLGMVPGWSGTQRLVRRFGAQTVRRLSLTGDMVEGPDALALGIVDEVVPRGAGLARAEAIAAAVAARGPVAVQVAKQMINAAEGEDADLAFESMAGALTSYTADLREGVAAFREKRAPRFDGR
ncbi:enoyl-CoA hydratase/isomerase family protein [Prosthecomicrobium sp. N25]|uniref:enoyl-CoA hydratase/isomerase family protein n=1 Tax=Prosthecomicrobium sp. N25 TaxID=3129254 RepID=UPI003076D304